MSLESLQERLLALKETTRQIQDLIARLHDFKFQPGSVPLELDYDEDPEGEGEGNVMLEMGNEIHQTLKEAEEDLEILGLELEGVVVGRQEKDQNQKRLLNDEILKLEGGLKSSRQSFRKAQISAKRNLDLAQKTERALLTSSFTNVSTSVDSLPVPASIPRRKPLTSSTEFSKEDKTLAAATSVTSALRQTHTLLASELSRSQFAHETLQESTRALKELGESYSTLDTMLSRSRTLVGTLLTSNKSDTWYLESAFYLLCATIGWLVFRRFIYGPAWWLVWVPLKLFYKAWMGVFVAVGLRSSRDRVLAKDYGRGSKSAVGGASMGERASASIAGSNAPSVRVGQDVPQSEEGMIGEVVKIIDGVQGGDSGEPSAEEKVEAGNPKKRMWEEEIEVKKEDQRKDEL